MRKIFLALVFCALLGAVLATPPAPAQAAGPQWVVVSAGDTLFSIAVRYGTSVNALMQANNLPNPNFVYSGQRLVIPAGSRAGTSAAAPLANSTAAGAYYTVRAGDTLYLIAARYGTSINSIARANSLWSYNTIYTGQQLRIPGVSGPVANAPAVSAAPVLKPVAPPPAPASAPAANPASAGKWIDVNIGSQTITAYEGSTPVKSSLVSTGIAVHPTIVGRFAIYAKYTAIRMTGGTPGVDYYNLPNVPWTMFFYRGFAVHGTYWHHNFGTPMSHGCVNLSIPDAAWLYSFASVGTLVNVHY